MVLLGTGVKERDSCWRRRQQQPMTARCCGTGDWRLRGHARVKLDHCKELWPEMGEMRNDGDLLEQLYDRLQTSETTALLPAKHSDAHWANGLERRHATSYLG